MSMFQTTCRQVLLTCLVLLRHPAHPLLVVKVYISIYSDPKGKKRAMDRLKKLEGKHRLLLQSIPQTAHDLLCPALHQQLVRYTRTQIGQRVTLRLTPEIRFEYDDSLDQAELGDGNEGFFDEYEKDVVEDEEDDEGELMARPRDRRRFVVGSTEAQMMQPGPFDDLFTGPEDDDVLVGTSSLQQDRTSKNRAKRQRRKEQQQAKKQEAQN
eukprot:429476-Pelagomonas_calceolata.AAC.1